MISERDILGTQLVRRNDELALLYEKIKIQQSTLNKGNGCFCCSFACPVHRQCLKPTVSIILLILLACVLKSLNFGVETSSFC